MTRVLVTTALEETWPEDRPILFLGEWCRRFSRRHRWSHLEAEVLPYHWDDRERLYADYQYLVSLHERLLADLAQALNDIHQVDRSLRYWRILIGPWLGYFVQILFDRWKSIQAAAQYGEPLETIVIDQAGTQTIPNDMSEFVQLLPRDDWNHCLYSDVLKSARCGIGFNHLSVAPSDNIVQKTIKIPLKAHFKKFLAAFLDRVSATLCMKKNFFFLSTYLPKADVIRLCYRLGQFPQFWALPSIVRVESDLMRRTWKVPGPAGDEFAALARELIPRHIPTAYLEGYQALLSRVAELPWPTRPRLIWSSNAHNANDVFKAWVADKSASGAVLVIGQHGGHYGTGLWSFTEEHDTAIGDGYLTWGWCDPKKPNVIPLGQLKRKRPLRIRVSNPSRLLLVSAAAPRYSYWMYSIPVAAAQWGQYLCEQINFAAALPRQVRDHLIVRLYPSDFGLDQRARWRERFPDIEIDDAHMGINRQIRRSRLYVSTYNATTFLETFTMNVPTVIFWNPHHWELRDAAKPYFDRLADVGVFHSSPESAARHIAAIWEDVAGWWGQDRVQTAIGDFKKCYCNLPDGMMNRLEKTLRQLAVTNRNQNNP